MTNASMRRRLTQAGDDPRAEVEIDAKVGAAKEEAGASRLREDLLARSLVDRLRALMTPENEGYLTLVWGKGMAGCSVANGAQIGASAGAPSIPAALEQALADMTEVGF